MWHADKILCGDDTSVKVAFEYGYQLIIPEGTCTTFDRDDIPAETINGYGHLGGALQMS